MSRNPYDEIHVSFYSIKRQSYNTQSLLGHLTVPMCLHVLCISYKYMTAQSILLALSNLNHVSGSPLRAVIH